MGKEQVGASRIAAEVADKAAKAVNRSPEEDKISVPERPNSYFDRRQHMLQAMKLCGILKEEGNKDKMKVVFHIFGDNVSKIDITHLDI